MRQAGALLFAFVVGTTLYSDKMPFAGVIPATERCGVPGVGLSRIGHVAHDVQVQFRPPFEVVRDTCIYRPLSRVPRIKGPFSYGHPRTVSKITIRPDHWKSSFNSKDATATLVDFGSRTTIINKPYVTLNNLPRKEGGSFTPFSPRPNSDTYDRKRRRMSGVKLFSGQINSGLSQSRLTTSDHDKRPSQASNSNGSQSRNRSRVIVGRVKEPLSDRLRDYIVLAGLWSLLIYLWSVWRETYVIGNGGYQEGEEYK